MIGKIIAFLIICGFLYIFFNVWFYVFVILIMLYVAYKFIRRAMTPKGHRIKHKALRGYLTQKYGRRDGKSMYREFVSSLRKKGYR
jgi:hypothetical protein